MYGSDLFEVNFLSYLEEDNNLLISGHSSSF